MSIEHPTIRRLGTVLGVIAVLALGVGSIQAAPAWTSAEAPLTVAPVSVSTLQTALADEHARSLALTERLRELDARSRELETALAQADDRVTTDASNADDLEGQLADASARLQKLEAAIAKAKRQLAAQVAAASRAARTASATSTSSNGARDDDEHEDDDEGEHDD